MIPINKKRIILSDMLRSDRAADAYLELSREYDDVSVSELLKSIGFDVETAGLYKKRISHYVDGDSFNFDFINDLKNRVSTFSTKFTKYKNIRDNADAFDDIVVDECFDVENTLKTVRINSNINYVMPEEYKLCNVDFSNFGLQYFKGLIINDGRTVPYVLNYAYKCSVCEEMYYFDKEPMSKKCSKCRANLNYSSNDSSVITMHACKVMVRNQSRDCVSLFELPQGYVDIAGIPTMEENDFGIFALACAKPNRVPIDVTFYDGRDRLLQMIDIIDKHHNDVIKKHILGLIHYKMAMILSRFAVVCNDPTMNVLVIGDPGTGKTYTGRLYSYALAEYAKVQDMSRLSLPGFLGSADEMKFFGQKVSVVQPGIVERNEMVVLDEFFDRSNTELNKMKSSLSEATISSELHGNRRSVRKQASVIGTANISNFHLRRVVERQLTMIGDIGAMNLSSIKNMNDNLKDEYTIEGLNWRDGEPLALLDRFPIIFYMESDEIESDDIDINLLSGDDDKMDETVLHDLIYIEEIKEYMLECAKIEFVVDDFHVNAVKTIIKLFFKERGNNTFEFGDNIHSKQRFRKFVDKIMRYHSMLNGRDKNTPETVEWMKKFYKYTCNFFPVSKLVWDEEIVKPKEEDVTIADNIVSKVENYSILSREFSFDDCVSAMSMSGVSAKDVKKSLDVLVEYGKLDYIPPTEYKVK